MLAKGGSIVMVYLFHLYISNKHGEEAIGVFSLLFTLLSITVVIAKLGLDTAIVKYIASFKEKQQSGKIRSIFSYGFGIILLTSLLIGTGVYFTANQLEGIFFDASLVFPYSPFLILAIAIPMYAILTFNAEAMRGLEKMGAYAFLQNVSLFAGALIAALLIPVGFEPLLIAPVGFLGGLIFVMMISLGMVWWILPLSATKVKFGQPKSLLKESSSMMLSNTVFFLMAWMDIIMIGFYMQEDQTGIYSNASKIANLSIFFLFAINAIAAPKIAALKSSGSAQDFKSFVKTTSKLSIILSAPIFLIIFLFPEFLLGLFGEGFVAGKWSLIILTCGQVFNACAGSVINALNMTGKEIPARNIIIFAAIVNITLNAILIPYYGITGAAIATATSTFLWNTMAVLYIYKEFKFLTVTLPWQKA